MRTVLLDSVNKKMTNWTNKSEYKDKERNGGGALNVMAFVQYIFYQTVMFNKRTFSS